MSPEQAQGLTDVTPAADIFSWASTVTFAGRGVPPFGEGDAAGVLYRVVHDPADLTNVDPTIVPYLDAALEKDPENRPTSLELAGGLSSLLNGAAAGAEPAATAVMAAWQPAWGGDMPDAAMTLAAAREMREELPPRDAIVRYQERRKANRKILVIALASALALAAIGYFALIRDRRQGDRAHAGRAARPTGVRQRLDVAGATHSLPPGESTTVAGGAPAGGGRHDGRARRRQRPLLPRRPADRAPASDRPWRRSRRTHFRARPRAATRSAPCGLQVTRSSSRSASPTRSVEQLPNRRPDPRRVRQAARLRPEDPRGHLVHMPDSAQPTDTINLEKATTANKTQDAGLHRRGAAPTTAKSRVRRSDSTSSTRATSRSSVRDARVVNVTTPPADA